MNGKKSPARSIDVARLAGVSRSAVSRTFTPGAYVSSQTREKVLQAATRLDYSPNVIARSLIKQRTFIVGVAVTDLRNSFYALLLEHLTQKLERNGLATLLCISDRKDSDAAIGKLLDYQVDAVILSAIMLSSGLAARCQNWGKPVVLVDRYIDSESITSITGDNAGGAALVADSLVSAGYERVAFMSGYPDTSSSRDRERGFRDRLSELGKLVYATECGDYTEEGAAEAMRRLMRLHPRPDAVFCANDLMALSALRVAEDEFSLLVPEDLGIAGYDNSSAAFHSGSGLTTVDQNVEEMAEMAVAAVLARLADPLLPAEQRTVASELVWRRTVRLPLQVP